MGGKHEKRKRLDSASFRRWVRDLRRAFPGDMPVSVTWYQREPTSGAQGVCRFPADFGGSGWKKGKVQIQVWCLDHQTAIDTLLHEWAHYLLGEQAIDSDPLTHHPDEWGVIYAKLYRWYESQEG